MVSDGKHTYFYDPKEKLYSVTDADDEIDDVPGLHFVLRDSSASILLFLLKTNTYEAVMEDVRAVTYGGREKIGGVPCHRIRFEQAAFDIDVWYAEGEQPWMMQLKLDFTRAATETRKRLEEAGEKVSSGLVPDGDAFSMRFSDWKRGPLPENTFKFVPPPDAKRDELEKGDAGVLK